MSDLGRLESLECREQEIARISAALHDLCQPLTTLQCRLEMAELVDTSAGYQDAVKMGLRECLRLSAAVGLMRSAVRAAMPQAGDDVELGAAR
jgi:hypothetical protein